MPLFELTKKQYLETMAEKMTDVTETAEPVTYIWDYVEKLVENSLLPEYSYTNKLVEYVYCSGYNSFHHILIFTGEKNVFIVIVVDVTKKAIYGHYLLNLNEEYGL